MAGEAVTRRRRVQLLLAVLVVLAIVPALWWQIAGPRSTPSGQPPLADFRLDDFERQFQAARATRLVVLLSPT
jgi:hypothetical protein